jgi:Glycosyltransferase family 87
MGELRWGSLGRASVDVLGVVLLAMLPVTALVVVAVSSERAGVLGYDFHESFLPAARAVLHGGNPYASTTLRALHAGTAFVYPPVAAFLYAPVALLPGTSAVAVASALAAAAVPATLLALGVRDWRCHGSALLWLPVVSAIHLAAISTLLALGVALAWRFRDRGVIGGVIVGLVIALKLFLWPLGIWLLAARRFRATVAAAAATVAFLLVPWAAIGFAGLGSYPHVLRQLSAIEARESYTLAAAVEQLGATSTAAQAAGLLAGLVCLFALARAAVRGGQERTVLVLALALALLLSPIVWMHYFSLLLVAVPLYAARFRVAWLLPVALGAFPVLPGAASAWEIVAALGLVAGSVVLAAREPRPAGQLRGRGRRVAAIPEAAAAFDLGVPST